MRKRRERGRNRRDMVFLLACSPRGSVRSSMLAWKEQGMLGRRTHVVFMAYHTPLAIGPREIKVAVI